MVRTCCCGCLQAQLLDSDPWAHLNVKWTVVDGYVGNKCAVFPLCLHGFDVSPINSVHFSNHTGYGSWAGSVLGGEELLAIMDKLETNGLLHYSHLLTGYMGSASFLRAIRECVSRLRRANPKLEYVCDPVMGDHGKLYVPEELVEIYRDEIVPCATLLTPNEFECELLTGVEIGSVSDTVRACDVLHERGVQSVVVTSASLGGPDTVTLVASVPFEKVASSDLFVGRDGDGTHARFIVDIPKLEGRFTGTGDLVAALLLVWGELMPHDFVGAVERTVAAVQAVLHRTVADGDSKRELRLVQSKKDLENPTVSLRARRVGAA